MNILIVVDDYSGGAGNMAQIIALELKNKGFKVSILLTYMYAKPRYNLNNIDIYEVNLSNIYKGYIKKIKYMIEAVKRIIELSKAEVIISFLDNNNIITGFANKKTKLPLIVSERSNPIEIHPKFPWNILRKKAYQYADIVGIQFDEFKYFDNGLFKEKCYELPNIILKSQNSKKDWNIKKVGFISLGRYNSIKRFELMIKLFSEFAKDKDNVYLDIYGSNIECDNLKKIIIEKNMENKIFLHDKICNVYEILSKHDVYLMTSKQEGFPNALSEALAVGLPAVVFNCHSGISKLVRNGINGYCVNDDRSFINSLNLIMESANKRENFGFQSLKISEEYSKERVIEIWETCIKMAIKKRQNTL